MTRRRAALAARLVLGACLGLGGPAAGLGAADAQTAPGAAVEPLAVIDALYPEGPVVIDGDLYVAEMTADRIRRFSKQADADGKRRLVADLGWAERGCGPTALAEIAGGRIAALCHLGGYVAILERSETGEDAARWRRVQRIEVSQEGVRLNSANDIVADGRGGAYFSNAGRFTPQSPPEGRVIHLAPDLTARVVAEGLNYANGVALSPLGGALLVSEHLGKRVWRYPVLDDARLGPGETLLGAGALSLDGAAPLVGPDGIEPIGADRAAIALYGDGRVVVVRLGASASVARAISAPFDYVTNVALWDDWLVLVGAYDNRARPYPGGVALYRAAEAIGAE